MSTPAASSLAPSEHALAAIDLLNAYAPVFGVAFIVTLLVTPLVRRLAIHAGVVDRPDGVRKKHAVPVAYLGGVAVFAGLMAAIGFSFTLQDDATGLFSPVPWSVIIGMAAIAFTGLADDVWHWDPRLKIAGQLIAAAALAVNDIGVRVAAGALLPLAGFVDPILGTENLAWAVPIAGGVIPIDLVYWAGTALIAIFVLGGCNAANLIDGLDGLLSGVTAITAAGLLIISLIVASIMTTGDLTALAASGEPALGGARIVLSAALLGACLGFLPHNFNPAVIFLGDCGSLLLGYMSVVIILMLGAQGQTHLVFAGLLVFAVPVMDTLLAIIRRKLSGRRMSDPDDQHIHHQLRRALGTVKRAVFALYGLALVFATLGVVLAAVTVLGPLRVRIVYVVAFVVFSFIITLAIKSARRNQALAHQHAPDAPDPTATAAAAAKTTDPLPEREPSSTSA